MHYVLCMSKYLIYCLRPDGVILVPTYLLTEDLLVHEDEDFSQEIPPPDYEVTNTTRLPYGRKGGGFNKVGHYLTRFFLQVTHIMFSFIKCYI